LASPYASPFLSPYASPFTSPLTLPYSYAAPYRYGLTLPPLLPQSPFTSLYSAPFASPLLPPFSYPAPYEYDSPLPPTAPSLAAPLLIKDILTAAFTSQPLAPHETRTGFLFFPRPTVRETALTLMWDWYNCVTREWHARLSVPAL
jgi:hypothetical protein